MTVLFSDGFERYGAKGAKLESDRFSDKKIPKIARNAPVTIIGIDLARGPDVAVRTTYQGNKIVKIEVL